jgi:hypothetical protein
MGSESVQVRVPAQENLVDDGGLHPGIYVRRKI